jgi:uncharacterized protein YehS (DUF1456 family)
MSTYIWINVYPLVSFRPKMDNRRHLEESLMDNNSVLRSLRYALDCNDAQMARILALGGIELETVDMEAMLRQDDEEGFTPCENETLSRFLDGLIIHRRGPSDRPGAERQVVSIDNNIILKKLRIAYEFREEDMIRTFEKAEFPISGTELTALFRKKGHKHYKECGDQLLRRFLKGLTVKE